MKRLNIFFIVCIYVTFFAGCSQPDLEDPQEIIARSLKKHGSEALANWETMVIKGEVFQDDVGHTFRGEYLQYAQKPDKLRIDRNLTKFERGRLFYTYIYKLSRICYTSCSLWHISFYFV